MEGRARGWFAGAWACLALLCAVELFALTRTLDLCTASWVLSPEPADWRQWPVVDWATTCRGVCLTEGTALEGCRDDHPGEPRVWLRHEPGSDIYVVAGAPRPDDAPRERFVEAVRRRAFFRFALRSTQALAFCSALGIAITVLAAGIAVARRRLRRLGTLARTSREAVLSLATGGGTYRRPPTRQTEDAQARADLAWSVDGELRAVDALRAALWAVAALIAALLVCTGGVVAEAWARFMF